MIEQQTKPFTPETSRLNKEASLQAKTDSPTHPDKEQARPRAASCSKRFYYGLSFLIPFLSVTGIYALDAQMTSSSMCQAVLPGLLAGTTGLVLYRALKLIRHNKCG